MTNEVEKLKERIEELEDILSIVPERIRDAFEEGFQDGQENDILPCPPCPADHWGISTAKKEADNMMAVYLPGKGATT